MNLIVHELASVVVWRQEKDDLPTHASHYQSPTGEITFTGGGQWKIHAEPDRGQAISEVVVLDFGVHHVKLETDLMPQGHRTLVRNLLYINGILRTKNETIENKPAFTIEPMGLVFGGLKTTLPDPHTVSTGHTIMLKRGESVTQFVSDGTKWLEVPNPIADDAIDALKYATSGMKLPELEHPDHDPDFLKDLKTV